MAKKKGHGKDRREAAKDRKQINSLPHDLRPGSMRCKSLLFILFLLFTIVQVMGQVRSNKDLVGRWSASSLKLEFLPDGRVMFAMKGGSIPGARYKTDFAQTPPSLAIELVQKSRKIIYNFGLEFISNNALRLTTLNSDASNAFDKQRSVILKKDQ